MLGIVGLRLVDAVGSGDGVYRAVCLVNDENGWRVEVRNNEQLKQATERSLSLD